MKAVKVKKANAEKAKRLMIEEGIMDLDFSPESEADFVYFPLRKNFANQIPLLKKRGLEVTDKRLEKSGSKKQLKPALEGELSKKEMDAMNRSYDVIGSIAILEIPKELKGREKTIAKALLMLNKSVKTVLRKSDIHKGEFRTQKLSYVAGKRTKETVHKENGCLMMLDVERVYFSPRLATERKRVAGLVTPGERVLVMFSGCGPYPLVISKNTLAKEIVGIEKNRVAHEYALKNIMLNKTGNVRLFCGDVRKEVPKLKERFGRIIMPLPKDADNFLDTAFLASRKGTIVQLYLFIDKEELEADGGRARVGLLSARYGRRLKYIGLVRCGQYSPSTFRACLEFQIL